MKPVIPALREATLSLCLILLFTTLSACTGGVQSILGKSSGTETNKNTVSSSPLISSTPQTALVNELDKTIINSNSIASGESHFCAIESNHGAVHCWSRRGDEDVLSGKPDQVYASTVVAGLWHTCVIRSDTDELSCWGLNSFGQTKPPSGIKKVKEIAAGATHTCVIRDQDATVSCWGQANTAWTKIPDDRVNSKAFAITAGEWHTCAIWEDGAVSCWGQSDALPSTSDLTELIGAKAISAGRQSTCAIKSDNSVKCWGRLDSGTDMKLKPSDLKVKAIAVGRFQTCTITLDDSVFCWGSKSHGALEPPALLKNVKQISTGESHACVIDSLNALQCWNGRDLSEQESVNKSPFSDVVKYGVSK